MIMPWPKLLFTLTFGLLICLESFADEQKPGEWRHYGADAGGSRYSALDQITPENVDTLEVAWTYRTGDQASNGNPQVSFENTPLMVGGTLYVCTPYNRLIALDAATGEEMWSFDPVVDQSVPYGNQHVCRGVTYWVEENKADGEPCYARLFMATNDSRLYAIDARTGSSCADFGDTGLVNMGPTADPYYSGEFQVTSEPVVLGDIVIVGSAISDNVRTQAPPGTVRAYDARTGASKWNFDPLVRVNDRPKAGHANVWSSMSIDEERGLVFLPTGSASPDFYGGNRPGNNHHANSVVALKATTGDLVWAFQTVHHDVWDYDLPAQPTLATLDLADGPRDVVIQVTKTGFIFVLDRDSGEPVFEVIEQPTPQGGEAGELLSPTQPLPSKPSPLGPLGLNPEDAWGFTFFDKAACRAKIEAARSEGLYTPPSLQGTILYPGTGGGANWGGGAIDLKSGTYVINTSRVAHFVQLIAREDYEARKEEGGHAGIAPQLGSPYAMKRELLLSPFGVPCNTPPWGVLTAIDLNSGEHLWERTLGTTEDMAPLGIALPLGTPNFGGPIITSGGLIFIGAAMDNYLRAFSLKSGRELWKGRLPAGGQATPMAYSVDGKQFVVIAAGGHGMSGTTPGDYVIAFALPTEPVD